MEPLIFNSPIVPLKAGGEVKGTTATMHRASDGTPLFIQVRKVDHWVTIPWADCGPITSV